MNVKIAIVGSRDYTNKSKIKDFIYKLKEEHGKLIEIVSGGAKYGADKYARKYALELNMKYTEFPPYHEPHNIYCVENRFKYDKKYNVKHYFIRNEEIVKYSDAVIAFITDGEMSSGTNNTIGHAKRHKKKYILIS